VYQAAVSQEMLLRAALALVVTAIYERVAWKYVDRSYRYIMLEAGHLGQNVYLTATALGLGPSSIGAFFDDEVNQLIGVNGRNEAAVYLLSIGTTA
jgi:SagB-type dehydrogenase family enzyme